MNDLRKSVISGLVSGCLVLGSLFSVTAQAAMVSSESAISEHATQYDRATLMKAIHEQGVMDQLSAMGVDPAQLEERIQTLTPQELAQLNDNIQDLPAGQGIVGVLLTVFVVFVITDLLCATNIFPFINCIR